MNTSYQDAVMTLPAGVVQLAEQRKQRILLYWGVAAAVCLVASGICLYCISSPETRVGADADTTVVVAPAAKALTLATVIASATSVVGLGIAYLRKAEEFAQPILNQLRILGVNVPNLPTVPNTVGPITVGPTAAGPTANVTTIGPAAITTALSLSSLVLGDIPADVREIVAAAIAFSMMAKDAPDRQAAEKRLIMALLGAVGDYVGTKSPGCKAAVSLIASEVTSVLFAQPAQPAQPANDPQATPVKPGPITVKPAA